MRVRLFILSLLLAATVPAQAYVERFNLPNGTLIPGWTSRVGNWRVQNQRLYTSDSYAYITSDKFMAKDGVVECEVWFTNTGLQFCGVVARHPGATTPTTNLVYGKIQNNASGPGYDRLFLYELPGGSTWFDVLNLPQGAIIRLTVLDNMAWFEADTNKDGRFDYATPPRTLSSVLGSGLVGLVGYRNGEYDNFKFFDAVLVPTGGSTPKIGTTFTMQLRAPQPTPPPPPTLYFCYAALKKREIQLGAKMLPIDIDVMFSLSLSSPAIFANFNGLLDANFDAFPSFVIPNNPALIGLELYFSAFTIDPKQPFSLGNIANDLRVQIIP